MVPNISTIHYAEWQYLFKEGLDDQTEWRVREQIATLIDETVSLYNDVYIDTSYCCQGEGFQIMSDNKNNLISAAAELSRNLDRYKVKYLKPL